MLSERIKLERKRRKWNESNLAERAGVFRATLQKIEAGEMTYAIGLVFEVAALVGVTLFESDKQPLAKHIQNSYDTLALLPQRRQKRWTMTSKFTNAPKEAYVWIWLSGETNPVVAGNLEAHGDEIQFNYGKSNLERVNDEKQAISIYAPELLLEN